MSAIGQKHFNISEVDGLEIFSLVDNSVDFLSTIEKKGKITREELLVMFNIKPEELDQEFAIFRHCELVRAFKEGNKVYFTKW